MVHGTALAPALSAREGSGGLPPWSQLSAKVTGSSPRLHPAARLHPQLRLANSCHWEVLRWRLLFSMSPRWQEARSATRGVLFASSPFSFALGAARRTDAEKISARQSPGRSFCRLYGAGSRTLPGPPTMRLPDAPVHDTMGRLECSGHEPFSLRSNQVTTMSDAVRTWSRRDLQFVGRTLIPERSDSDHVAELLGEDESLVGAMLEDDRLFEQLMANEEVFLSVSPRFFFDVLLRRARRELERETFTIERRHQQKVVLFDAKQVVDLLSQPSICDYLSTMLASFTRINSMTIPVRVRKGIWHRIRVNDLDVDSLIRYAQVLDDDQRFWAYQRIADACLFLTGVFPESIEPPQRLTQGVQPRFRMRSSLLRSLEDYEEYGRAFYRLAAEHRLARLQASDRVLATLSEQFILAEKPLAFLAGRYLSLRKQRLFQR